jgi:hypothetical protein
MTMIRRWDFFFILIALLNKKMMSIFIINISTK